MSFINTKGFEIWTEQDRKKMAKKTSEYAWGLVARETSKLGRELTTQELEAYRYPLSRQIIDKYALPVTAVSNSIPKTIKTVVYKNDKFTYI
jgi:hypothetical protein